METEDGGYSFIEKGKSGAPIVHSYFEKIKNGVSYLYSFISASISISIFNLYIYP